MKSLLLLKYLLLAVILFMLVTACGGLGSISTLTPIPLPSLTPTITPIPRALIVNDDSITQAEFDAELLRYQQADEALGLTTDPEVASQAVLDDFINQLLLVQGAAGLGYVVDDAALQAHLDSLAAEVGGLEALLDWQVEHGYTEADFSVAMRRQMAAAWMRDHIITAIGLTADQVHVRQIFFNNEADAQSVYDRLQTGYDFTTVAQQYDPLTKGELGWFPRGYLVHPAIEQAAFDLEPGTYSPVVTSSVGFHILYLVERDPAHPLSPDALLTLQEKALTDWLTQSRNESTIIYPP
jgi:peptidyl-prolyl cis-trans isomerase C